MKRDLEQRVLVIIPAYNEEHSIADVLNRLYRVAPMFDRVVINDGSTDRTGDVILALGERQLRLPCNLGYGLAVQTGLKYALVRGYDIIVCLDADGQHQPEDVPLLVNALREQKAGMVIGSRFCEGNSYDTPLDRRLGQLLFSHLTRLLLGRRIYDTSSGFKALEKSACEVIVQGTFMDFHIETIVRLSMLGFTIVETPVVVQERVSGRSMHSFTSIYQYPLKTILLTIVAAVDAILARRAR